MILLIKLLLAHMIGDFMLQPKSWVKAKEKRKLKAYQLYLHVMLHGLLIMLLVLDWTFLPWAALISFTHGIIDVTKLFLQKDKSKRSYFFIDQIAHVISIYLIYSWYRGYTEIDVTLLSDSNFLLATIIVFLTAPTSFIIKMFISKWTSHTEDDVKESLEDAGMYIGIFERLFIFVFVITKHWEAIGFLLAAKSVFRFGDLREPKDRNLTEYILIGTLVSFGIAILTGMVYECYLNEFLTDGF